MRLVERVHSRSYRDFLAGKGFETQGRIKNERFEESGVIRNRRAALTGGNTETQTDLFFLPARRRHSILKIPFIFRIS